jgi:hypothetical protein
LARWILVNGYWGLGISYWGLVSGVWLMGIRYWGLINIIFSIDYQILKQNK